MTTSRLDRPTVYGWRAKLGLIVPPTNTVNEAEWNLMAPDGVTIHSARMPLHTDTTSVDGKAALYADVSRFAADLAAARVDVIAYGCTAGSMISPIDELATFMLEHTGRPAVTTSQALIRALQSLGATRVSVATPYHDELNQHEAAFLREHGIEPVAVTGLGYGENGPDEYRNIAHVPPEEVYDLARSVAAPDIDAMLISCTDLPTLEIIPRLESDLGLPVVTSNQATFWATVRLAGIKERFEEFGALLREH